MVKIRKPKKDNKEVIPVDNPEVIQEGISKAEEFITKNKNLLYLATGIILVLFISFIIAASVVDFPEPVGPVTKTKPL